MNTFIDSLMPFIDLTALASLVGIVLCLFWTVCPVYADSPINTCFTRCRRLILFCLLGLSISSIGLLLQRAMVMAGLGIADIIPVLPTVLFSTHYGSIWLVRASGIVVAWCVWWLGKRHLNSRILTILLLIACAAIAFSRSASSHGADHGDFSLQEFSDWFHLMAAMSWGGTLLSISLLFSASSVADSTEHQHIVSGIADRVYVLFGPVLAVLVFTGLYNSWVEVGSFGVLLTTTYGQFLSVKLLIFAYLSSRYIAPPQKGNDETAYARKFIKRSRIEAFLILVLLLCVALFTQQVPARHATMMMMSHEYTMDSYHEMGTGQGISPRVKESQIKNLSKLTYHGLYSVAIVVKDKDLKVGVNTFDITVHDKSGNDVAGAEIKVVPWMPEMGHGVFDKPVVKERGGGTYSIENVILIMEGRWEFRLTINKNHEEDNVTFAFPVVS